MTDIEHDKAWLAQLRQQRAERKAKPEGVVLGEPQCAEACLTCTLGCAMATFMVARLEQALHTTTVH